MKSLFLQFCYLSVYFLLSCSAEPPQQEVSAIEESEPVPYLYKIPTVAADGLPVAKLKKEALAEAFVSRLSTKAPAGVVVMQQENIVLEEYFGMDSMALVSTGHGCPAYIAALLGGIYRNKTGVPHTAIPLQEFYNPKASSRGALLASDISVDPEQPQEFLQRLENLVYHHTGTSMGMAAEEFLFEPLQIDEYKWADSSLWIHPHGILQLGSLLVRRGRWGNLQILPDALVQRIMTPAYANNNDLINESFGWRYYKIMAKGRKHSVLYWQHNNTHLFLLPDVEAVVLVQGKKTINA